MDKVTFEATTYRGTEGSGVVNVTLTRTGDLTDSITIPFRARATPNATNAAEGQRLHVDHGVVPLITDHNYNQCC